MDNSTFLSSIWAITPEEFQRFANYDFSRFADPLAIDNPVTSTKSAEGADGSEKSHKERVADFMRQFEEKIEMSDDGTGTIRICGPIMPNPDIYDRYYFNACDSVRVASLIRSAARSEEVTKLVLMINSPGGMVVGTPEVGEAIREFNATGRESIAFADTLMASAAYWIGSQATSLISTGSALIGSIGVIRPHVDMSGAYEKYGLKIQVFRGGKHKVPGAMNTALTEEQSEHIQAGVDECHEQFKAAVNFRRNVSEDCMEGKVYYGTDAASKGLVDKIVTGADDIHSSAYNDDIHANAHNASINISVDNTENAMSKPADPPIVASPEKAELDSALARVSELEVQNASATEQVATITAERDSISADLVSAQTRVTELEASLTEATAKVESIQTDFDAKVDLAAKEKAEILAEAKAAGIAARSGTDPATISEGAEASSDAENDSAFASMSNADKWAHCATIEDKDEKRAFYVKHLQNS